MLSLMDLFDIALIFCTCCIVAGWVWHEYDKRFQAKRRLTKRDDKCPKCRSEDVDFAYEPNSNIIKYECRECGHKWQLIEV